MQPIIVGVDFSNTSVHAIDYAVSFANRMKSDIIMIWVGKMSSRESVYPDSSNEIRKEAKRRFDEIVETFSGKLVKGIKIEYKLRQGKVYHEVDMLARNTGARLIITGAHGISGYEEYWIGSNAFKVMTYASFPVITVRYDFPVNDGPKRILAPVDNSYETLQKFPLVAEYSRLFRSEVHLLATHSSDLKSIQRIVEKYTDQAYDFLRKQKIKTVRDSLVSSDITKSVINHAVAINAGLIAIMTEQETPKNILMGPCAQQLVNRSPVPVLSIHPRENFCL